MGLDERSQARTLALQALCVFDALGGPLIDDLDEFLRDRVKQEDLGWTRPLRSKYITLARTLAGGTWQQRERCDELLRQNVPGWSIERMQPVDRSILRLGLYELLKCPQTPPQVVISEAVELARRFGGADSPAFVNGVLDGVRRGIVGLETPANLSDAEDHAAETGRKEDD